MFRIAERVYQSQRGAEAPTCEANKTRFATIGACADYLNRPLFGIITQIQTVLLRPKIAITTARERSPIRLPGQMRLLWGLGLRGPVPERCE